jgi:very-short-patch-repair endonuclease
LLWSILRAKQLCNLKFRREHPIGPFITDFACLERKLVIELDGGYHDTCGQRDVNREAYLTRLGWTVIRFTDEDVTSDIERVARGISEFLGVPYEFSRRSKRGSGSEYLSTPETQQRSPAEGTDAKRRSAPNPPESGG